MQRRSVIVRTLRGRHGPSLAPFVLMILMGLSLCGLAIAATGDLPDQRITSEIERALKFDVSVSSHLIDVVSQFRGYQELGVRVLLSCLDLVAQCLDLLGDRRQFTLGRHQRT